MLQSEVYGGSVELSDNTCIGNEDLTSDYESCSEYGDAHPEKRTHHDKHSCYLASPHVLKDNTSEQEVPSEPA